MTVFRFWNKTHSDAVNASGRNSHTLNYAMKSPALKKIEIEKSDTNVYAFRMNIVIMAGGGGSRLWPLSRIGMPKQFIDVGTGTTLVELVFERACTLTAKEHVYVATSEKYREKIETLLPEVTAERIFYEPQRRDTTAAFASIALRLEKAGAADTPTIFMWSDHVFTEEESFLQDLRKIPQLIEQYPDHLVIVGHHPLSPETGLGYMEVGENIDGYKNVYRLKAFKEKPDLKTAEQYVAAQRYYWNLGYFSMRPAYLLRELIACSPELAQGVEVFRQALAEGSEQRVKAAYEEFPKVSIEYTLIEKTKRILAITGDYGWSDIGNWATLQQIFGTAGDHMPKGHHVHVDSKDNYVYNVTEKAVSLIGMENTIVVVTDDAVLVTAKDQAHKVKQVVERLEEEGQEKYL